MGKTTIAPITTILHVHLLGHALNSSIYDLLAYSVFVLVSSSQEDIIIPSFKSMQKDSLKPLVILKPYHGRFKERHNERLANDKLHVNEKA